MMAGSKRIDLEVSAAGANDAIRPPADNQVSDAVVLALKQRVELLDGHLVDWLRLFLAGHGVDPRSVGGPSHI
jgi:hypothetical protein